MSEFRAIFVLDFSVVNMNCISLIVTFPLIVFFCYFSAPRLNFTPNQYILPESNVSTDDGMFTLSTAVENISFNRNAFNHDSGYRNYYLR